MEDGGELESCKAFKFNLQDALFRYEVPLPEYMIKPTREFLEKTAQMQKRAYQELLEFCSKHLHKKGETKFKTIYTLGGYPLKSLVDLRDFCEKGDPEFIKPQNNIKIRKLHTMKTDSEMAESPIKRS